MGVQLSAGSTKDNVHALFNFKREADDTLKFQPVVFYEMHEDGTFENGTTLEEMLRVSIERLQILNGKFPCQENSIAITKLQEALIWLNTRTTNKEKRYVSSVKKTI